MKEIKNVGLIFVTIIILIILILIIIYVYLSLIKKNIESFDNFSINFQTGISEISQTGTITFSKPFANPPNIFTQIIGTSSSTSNIYSVQILNIKNTSFDYVKNMVYNDTSNNYNITKIGDSKLESFNWIAISS
jgi:hypothetical protein